MTNTKILNLTSAVRTAVVLSFTALVLSGCNATTKVQHQVAKIEVQEAVGFTITEEVRVSESERVKYYEALNYLQDEDLERGIAILEVVVEAAPMLTAPRIDLGIAHHRQGNLGTRPLIAFCLCDERFEAVPIQVGAVLIELVALAG